ncbi:LysM peptidoglycan-binding domain-containing protein [Wukongibacter baidiensis]|uniref:LysM peptidoglycan-binding domain-containing protein n=1 Tax=Wukongibacter baidiensis TaxID=1723361 RepID=UPI003D7F855E
MKKLRIVNRKRFMLSMTVIMITLFFLVSNVFAIVNRAEGYEEPKYKEVVVKNGDTIWELAREHGPKKVDVRKTVHEMGRINNLHNYDVFPGQIVKIPVK